MNWVLREPKRKVKKSDDFVEKIAKIRGIKDIDGFLNPREDVLHDPLHMKNIGIASDKIINAIISGAKILLSYDADADGLTSTTVLYRYLSHYTDNIDYIYNERNHGHGIYEQTRTNFIVDEDLDENGNIVNKDKLYRFDMNTENMNKVKDSDLLIIVDSSSNDTETCKKINEYGTEVIILDHHDIERENKYATIVNPKQKGCKYPNKNLSGAGVVLKTIQVIEDMLEEKELDKNVNIWDYSDLVAVGMYADVMPVNIPENRYLILNGLRNIKNAGLTRILKSAKADFYRLNGDSIGYSIAPLLNGVARMNQIKLAIDLLLEDDDTMCKKIRLKMNKINENRKAMQAEITENYRKKINKNQKVLIVVDEQASRGFNGLVAQQLSDEFKRIVMVGRLYDNKISGSFRAYNGFKFKSFLNRFDGEIEAVGHESAGGFTVKEEDLDKLLEYIDKFMEMPKDASDGKTVTYDIEIDSNDVKEHIRAVENLNKLTGNGFPKVIVKVKDVVVEEHSCIGKTQETVKFTTMDDFEMIKFKVNNKYGADVDYFDVVDVVGELRMNEFYNFGLKKRVITPQIIILDYVKTE